MHNYDLICLSETWLKSMISLNMKDVALKCYKDCHQDFHQIIRIVNVIYHVDNPDNAKIKAFTYTTKNV